MSNSDQQEVKLTLRELIDDAESRIAVYRNPNLDDVHAELEKLFIAAKIGSIAHDKITRLSIIGDELFIQTGWSARGCYDTTDYTIPMSIIDAPDPVRAAALWGSIDRLLTARQSVRVAEQALSDRRMQLAELEQEHQKLVDGEPNTDAHISDEPPPTSYALAAHVYQYGDQS